MVNPTFRLKEADDSARSVGGVRAEERWRKPRPSCNRADAGVAISTLPRKRADFQQGQSLRENL